MSLLWVCLGVFFQAMLGFMMFMLTIFAGAGLANGNPLNTTQNTILGLFVVILPATSAIAAGMLIYRYNTGGDAQTYWWHVLPVVAAAIYLIYFYSLSSK